MIYAIIEHSGRQYRVREGERIVLTHQPLAVGEKVDAEKVLLVADEDGNVEVGNPTVEMAKVTLKVVEQTKGEKIRVFRYEPKKHFKRTRGHRDKITVAEVEKIAVGSGRKSKKADEPAKENSESLEE